MRNDWTQIASAILKLVIYDAFFLALLMCFILALAYSRRAAHAVLKRNFLGYFANPTGYVFLCLFVLLTSMAAFWPHAFFSDNIGSLAQLNKWFVYIMLFFIPAITMSIWAEEKRQGTDELLLTLPADDFDIVVGKYAAAVSIFTTSLVFSQISTFIVLLSLTIGEVDIGLFFVNYLGYWFIGLAMIAIGMIASFLTSNLTVGFILGALFNAPLAFAQQSDVIAPNNVAARWIKNFSLVEQFDNFGRGVLSSASVFFFSLIAVFGLYLCMVLVGRRHWSAGKNGHAMFFHYIGRALLIAVTVIMGSEFLRNWDVVRADATEGKVSSLSDTTRKMIRELEPQHPIVVDAFLSADIPEMYAKTKFEIISLLKEFQSTASRAGVPVEVRINGSIERRSEEEDLAKDQFAIEPRMVQLRERGVLADKPVLLGAAFRSGLERVVIPFFELGVPVEYQLIQAMNTVSRPVRKKLAVLKTDAQLTGGIDMNAMRQVPRQRILEDLEKQYEIVEVDASAPIDVTLYDCMLAAQPSSLSPEQMTNFVNAVAAGLPTAIFEDPMPIAYGSLTGTGEPKQAGNPMLGGGQPMPKGDIRELWKTLEIDVPGKPSMMGGINPDIVWQRYMPYPALQNLEQATNEWVFIRQEQSQEVDLLSSESEITNGLEELMFLYSGSVKAKDDPSLSHLPLVTTMEQSGLVSYDDVNAQGGNAENIRMSEGPALGELHLAMLIEGAQDAEQEEDDAADDQSGSDDAEQPDAAAEPPTASSIRAVYVSDVDCLSDVFVAIRNNPDVYADVNFKMQNISFVLNIIDVLTGELDYPKVRRHVPSYKTLRLIELASAKARENASEQRKLFTEAFKQELDEAQADASRTVEEFNSKLKSLSSKGTITVEQRRQMQQAAQQLQTTMELTNRKVKVREEALKRERDEKIAKVEAETEREIRKTQNYYKMLAVFIPPIPPLLVGVAVFVSRRLREREGISKSRLK